jgi:hypothetical protein
MSRKTNTSRSYRTLQLNKGRYLYPWSGPIPIVKVRGKPNEMGLQHGKQKKELIQKTVSGTWDALPGIIGLTKDEIVREVMQYGEKIRECHADFGPEMEGIADGADVSYDDIVLLNSAINMLAMHGGEKALAALLCSSFAAWGKATRSGNVVAGHNDDGSRATDQYLVLLDAKPENGHHFWIPIVPGYLGYHTVANDSGFCAFGLGLEYGPKPEESRIGTPMWTIFRHLGQFQGDVESGIDFLSKVDRGMAGSFLMADKSRSGAIVHMAPQSMSVVRPQGDYLTLTNHALEEDIKRHLVLREKPSSTHYRLESITKAVKSRLGKIDYKSGTEIMSTHFDASVGAENPSGNTPCRHYEFDGRFAGTCRSAVVELGKKEMKVLVALGNPCTATWVEVDSKYS